MKKYKDDIAKEVREDRRKGNKKTIIAGVELTSYRGAKGVYPELAKGLLPPPQDLEHLIDSRSRFDLETRLEAVMAYLVTGSAKEAEKYSRVAASTIRLWRTKAAWWPDAVRMCQERMYEVLDSSLSTIIHKATEELKDRLDNGDVVVGRDGKKKRVPVKARDLAHILASTFDKRQIIRNNPTSIPGSVGEKSRMSELERLKRQFEEFTSSIIDVEGEDGGSKLQEGVRQLPGQTGADTEAFSPEQGPEEVDEEGSGPEGGW